MPGHDQVTIAGIEAKYHLPPSRRGEKERLDRILPVAAAEALEAGLERLGYGGREELCIREIRVPLRLRLSSPDDALALAWGDAMAAAIDEAVRGGEADRVLRFASRRQALADFARGVARGDLRHGWAWSQLGFGEAAGEENEAPAELARVLAADPEALVPILAGIAEAGLLPALVRRFESGWWPQLAALALATAGWSAIAFRGQVAGPPEGDVAAVEEARQDAGNPAPRTPGNAAVSSWRRARLAELFKILRVAESSPLAPALAALVLLEADPGRLAATPETEREALLAAAVATLVSPLAPPVSLPEAAVATRVSPLAPTAAEKTAAPDEATATPRPFAASGEDEDTLVARREGATDWGGLLFLVGLTGEIGLPAKIAAHPLLGPKTHRWCLHRLALELVPSHPEDPAVLAFAGLLPGHAPPEDEPTEEEIAALADLAETLLQSLAERLRIPGAGGTPELPATGRVDEGLPRSASLQGAGRPSPAGKENAADGLGLDEGAGLALPLARFGGRAGQALPLHQPPAPDGRSSRAALTRSLRLELLDLVCRRRARIVADPGWIEVRFSLDDVKTELRRARLDLDPGFVPWLGVVLRFFYE